MIGHARPYDKTKKGRLIKPAFKTSKQIAVIYSVARHDLSHGLHALLLAPAIWFADLE